MRSIRTLRTFATLAAFTCLPEVAGAQCPLDWEPAPLQLLTWDALATTVFDEGAGPRLWVSGERPSTSHSQRIVTRATDRWQVEAVVAPGPFNAAKPRVTVLEAFDLGSGPVLYAAGQWDRLNGATSFSIAQRAGGSWSNLGPGLQDPWDGAFVAALELHQDAHGTALYAAGEIELAGGQPVHNVARWDGSSWSAVGGSVFEWISALVSFDDGGGPALYAAGSSLWNGASTTPFVQRWNGTSWQQVGADFDGGHVFALEVFDGGSGPLLYAGGDFSSVGGLPASGAAVWDGVAWREVGGGVSGPGLPRVNALSVQDLGSGPELLLGGSFDAVGSTPAHGVASWDGTDWSPLGAGVGAEVHAFTTWSPCVAGTEDLVVVGKFQEAGGEYASKVALWDGGAWSPIAPSTGIDGVVNDSLVWDDGTGPALHVAGSFLHAGTTFANSVARWDGSSWSPMGTGLHGYNTGVAGDVTSLAVHDDGGGAMLYAGGSFSAQGGIAIDTLARWDGVGWESVSQDDFGWTHDLEVLDDGSGSGPQLYAGGSYLAGEHLLRWNGADWVGTPLDLTGAYGGQTGVWSLGSRTQPAGPPEILVGGYGLDVGSTTTEGAVLIWNGTSTTTILDGVSTPVEAVAAWTDPQGLAWVFAGGAWTSTHPSGPPAPFLVRWDGTSWSDVGGGVDGPVRELRVWDDGSGEALYVLGKFSTAGGVHSPSIARWDGTAFSAAGGGMASNLVSTEARTLTALPPELGAKAVLGGDVQLVGGAPSGNLAWWEEDCSVVPHCVGAPNSTGAGARIDSLGSVSVCMGDFTLTVEDCPPNVLGKFYYGPQAQQVPFGNGFGCVTGGVHRLLPVQNTGSTGSVQRLLDFASPPAGSGPGQILAGSTWHFQFWYRDPDAGGASFNLSDALEVSFEP